MMVFQGLVFGVADISSYVSDHCTVYCSSFREASRVTYRQNKVHRHAFHVSIQLEHLQYQTPVYCTQSLSI